MKGGGTVPVKESITLPDDALRAEGWYRTALDNPNRVTIGGYDTSKSRSDRQRPERRSAGAGDGHGSQLYHRPQRPHRNGGVLYHLPGKRGAAAVSLRPWHGHYPAAGRGRPGPVRGYGPGRTACLAWRERRAATQRHLQPAGGPGAPTGRTRNYLFILRQVPFAVGASPPLWTKGLSWTASWVSAHCWWGWCSACCCSSSCSPGTSWTAIVMPVQEPAGAMDRVARQRPGRTAAALGSPGAAAADFLLQPDGPEPEKHAGHQRGSPEAQASGRDARSCKVRSTPISL